LDSRNSSAEEKISTWIPYAMRRLAVASHIDESSSTIATIGLLV
jgi:hypothetical protein